MQHIFAIVTSTDFGWKWTTTNDNTWSENVKSDSCNQFVDSLENEVLIRLTYTQKKYEYFESLGEIIGKNFRNRLVIQINTSAIANYYTLF